MSKDITKWEPKKVIAAVSGALIQNMDIAAAFCAQEARARVPSARRWVRQGVYSSGILRRNILYEVHARGDVVEGRIGVRKKIYWGWMVERGTVKMRASPFLRPAVFQNASTILRILRGEM